MPFETTSFYSSLLIHQSTMVPPHLRTDTFGDINRIWLNNLKQPSLILSSRMFLLQERDDLISELQALFKILAFISFLL